MPLRLHARPLPRTALPRAALPARTEVVVIGGGIVGAFTALDLARSGRKVLLLERDRIGAAQSGRNLGWIRRQGRAEAELPLMIEASEQWKALSGRTRCSRLDFHETGSFYFGAGSDTRALYECYRQALHDYGVAAEILGPAQIARLHPGNDARWRIGLHTPTDGRIDPRHATLAITEAASEAGTLTVEGCRVLSVEGGGSGGDVTLHTSAGRIAAETVVIAAGAGSARLLRHLGVKLPQLCIDSTVIEVADPGARWSGCASDGSLAFYRNRLGHVGLSLCDRFVHRPSPASLNHLPKYLPVLGNCLRVTTLGRPGAAVEAARPSVTACLDRARARGLIGPEAAIARAWAGEIDILPDFLPAIGRAGTLGHVIVATGFSGHGFGIAPAAGRRVAALANGEPAPQDLAPFRLGRFHDGSKLVPGPTF